MGFPKWWGGALRSAEMRYHLPFQMNNSLGADIVLLWWPWTKCVRGLRQFIRNLWPHSSQTALANDPASLVFLPNPGRHLN
jgi:hypothetical protein